MADQMKPVLLRLRRKKNVAHLARRLDLWVWMARLTGRMCS